MRYNMNSEINKWDIYYLEQRYDITGNALTPHIKPAVWINSTKDYDHFSFELHHVIPYTDWERNTKNVREKTGGKNVLILLPKVMHQHLENPVYKLSKPDFERIYKIHPDEILYDINSRQKRKKDLFFIYPTNGSNNNIHNPNIYAPDFFDIDLSCFNPINELEAV